MGRSTGIEVLIDPRPNPFGGGAGEEMLMHKAMGFDVFVSTTTPFIASVGRILWAPGF